MRRHANYITAGAGDFYFKQTIGRLQVVTMHFSRAASCNSLNDNLAAASLDRANFNQSYFCCSGFAERQLGRPAKPACCRLAIRGEPTGFSQPDIRLIRQGRGRSAIRRTGPLPIRPTTVIGDDVGFVRLPYAIADCIELKARIHVPPAIELVDDTPSLQNAIKLPRKAK